MDRIINIKVGGNRLTKDSNKAGTRGEANVTTLRITFDEGWDKYAKSVLFLDAHGMNPTRRTLTTDLLENIVENTRIYLVPIPAEPMWLAGEMSFTVEGYVSGKRQRSVVGTLEVDDAIITDVGNDPTPSEVEMLQGQIDNIMGDIQRVTFYRTETENFANAAEQAREKIEKYIDSLVDVPVVDTGVTLDNTSNLNRDIKLFKKDGSEATDARDVYSGFLRLKYLFDPVPFTQDIMILQNIMEEGYIEYKEVHQIVFKGNRIYKRTVHVDCGDFDANGERAYPITQENYDDGNYNTGFYSVLWNDDLLDGGVIAEAIYQAMQELTPINADYNQNDTTKSDYIKNRPFYVGMEVVTDTEISDESAGWEIPFPGLRSLTLGDIFEIELTPLDTGKVITSGEIAVDYVSERLPIIPNLFLDDWIVEFSVTSDTISISSGGTALMGHVRIFKSVVKQLDEKFIPDTIARTADVEAVLDELHAYAQALIGGDA